MTKQPNEPHDITYREVMARWLPLAMSWCLMALEMPLVQSFVSKLPDSQHSLAGLGIVFAVCMLCEAPILMLVSTGSALVRDYQSFSKLRNFAIVLSLFMSVVFGLLTILLDLSGVLLVICKNDLLLTEKVYQACLISAIVPFVVGNRRFLQGVLIRSGKSFFLSFGTFVRLGLIVTVGYYLANYSDLNGTIVGAYTGVAGMVGESLAITLLSLGTIRRLKSNVTQESHYLSYSAIAKFYSPLAISGVVNLSILPVLTFFMSQGVQPVLSLASYHVLQGILFFLSAVALGMQEVVVSMLGTRQQGYRVLRNFALILAVSSAIIFALYVFSPLSRWVMVERMGISPELFLFLHPALILALPFPLLTVISVSMRGAVVLAKQTRWVTLSSFSELVAVLIMMFILQSISSSPAVFHAILALLVARLVSCGLLSKVFFGIRKEFLNSDFEKPRSTQRV